MLYHVCTFEAAREISHLWDHVHLEHRCEGGRRVALRLQNHPIGVPPTWLERR